jgi:hypothetical protein
MRVFKLPDLGEGIHEGEIIEVQVAPGEDITEGQPILTVETDKAAVEIPSPFTGTVTAIRAAGGRGETAGQARGPGAAGSVTVGASFHCPADGTFLEADSPCQPYG